ncbi:MAG: plasmid mobilization relaxosome protein MobC [Magnetococcus sp. YQC-9]
MEPKATKRRSSQKRERNARAICVVNDAEKAEIEAKAARAGLSVSGYLRTLIFGKGAPQLRGARRPVVEKELLVKLLGELGKIGSNINQIAHVANQGRGVNFPALIKLSSDLVVMRQQVKAALGREEPEAISSPSEEGDP